MAPPGGDYCATNQFAYFTPRELETSGADNRHSVALPGLREGSIGWVVAGLDVGRFMLAV